MIRFKTTDPGMSGGAIWQMADIKNYVKSNCSVSDPSVGNSYFSKRIYDAVEG
jgi:hypothetical protein